MPDVILKTYQNLAKLTLGLLKNTDAGSPRNLRLALAGYEIGKNYTYQRKKYTYMNENGVQEKFICFFCVS